MMGLVMSDLIDAIEGLKNPIEKLQVRLGTVTLDIPQEDKNPPPEPNHDLPPLGRSIRDLRDQIAALRYRVDYMTSSLEI